MSKHLGNILEPMPLMDEHGADAVRWFMLASGSPWLPRRVGHAAIQEGVRKVLLTYWNTASFLSLYGRTSGWSPTPRWHRQVADRPVLDRWVLSELNRLVRDVDVAMDGFDTQRAGARLTAFVDDLSNWYVRRSRRRFWDGDPAALAHAARVRRGADPAARSDGPVRHGAGLAGRRPRGDARCARVGAHGVLAARPTRPRSTTNWLSRSR